MFVCVLLTCMYICVVVWVSIWVSMRVGVCVCVHACVECVFKQTHDRQGASPAFYYSSNSQKRERVNKRWVDISFQRHRRGKRISLLPGVQLIIFSDRRQKLRFFSWRIFNTQCLKQRRPPWFVEQCYECDCGYHNDSNKRCIYWNRTGVLIKMLGDVYITQQYFSWSPRSPGARPVLILRWSSHSSVWFPLVATPVSIHLPIRE